MAIRFGRAALALTIVATAWACATPTTRANPFDPSSARGPTGADDPIKIEVQNLNFSDITVWALRQGQRIRVGRMSGKTDQTFTIQWNVAIPISFFIDTVGGRSCRTGQVGVDRDARVWVSIPSNVGIQPCRAGRR